MSIYYAYPNVLFYATVGKDLQIIKECIKNGYNINQQNSTLQTPLIRATKNNNLDIIKTLVENGADLNIVDSTDMTALDHAYGPVIKYLQSNGARRRQNLQSYISHPAERKQNYRRTLSTLKVMADQPDSFGFSPFMRTIYENNETKFKYYLAMGADINQRGRNGATPLIVAASQGNFDMVLELLGSDASVNESDDNGNTALTECFSMIFRLDIAELLINNGADVNGSGEGNVPPLIAAAFSTIDSVGIEFLIKQKAKVNLTDRRGNTALAYASFFGSFNNVKILIDNEADLDLCGEKGRTPLSWAVTAKNLKMVKFLLENGAKIDQTDYDECSALSYAKQYGHEEIIKYLEKHEISPLCSAIQEKNFELVKFLMERGEDPCAKDIGGNTPLIAAIRSKNKEIVKYLLENGADLTVQSALPIAIKENDTEIVKFLVDNGANVNKNYGSVKQTPLVQAVRMKNEGTVRFLVANGADPKLRDALRIAVELKCYNIVKFLIEKGADVNATGENQRSLLRMAIEQKNLRLIVLLVEWGVNVQNDLFGLKKFAEEDIDFQEFFDRKIRSQFGAKILLTIKFHKKEE